MTNVSDSVTVLYNVNLELCFKWIMLMVLLTFFAFTKKIRTFPHRFDSNIVNGFYQATERSL